MIDKVPMRDGLKIIFKKPKQKKLDKNDKLSSEKKDDK